MAGNLIPAKMLPYKKEIEAIINHSTDGKCGVRFNIKWKKYNIVSKERFHFIITFKNGKFLLRDYMERLQVTSKRRFQFMMQREPGLASLLEVATGQELLDRFLGQDEEEAEDNLPSAA